MSPQIDIPFYSIENAQQYIRLLSETVTEAKRDITGEITSAPDPLSERVRALRIVDYNLDKLRRHLSISGRALNDLRCLRRVLLEERPATSQTRRGVANTLPFTRAIPIADPQLVRKVGAAVTSKTPVEQPRRDFPVSQSLKGA